jgi:hypothetical protein
MLRLLVFAVVAAHEGFSRVTTLPQPSQRQEPAIRSSASLSPISTTKKTPQRFRTVHAIQLVT